MPKRNNPYNNMLLDKIAADTRGETASREQNDLLYPAVVSGDEAAIDKMIRINMPFVLSKVESYILAYPDIEYLRDDMVGEGLQELVVAVRKMAEEPSEAPNPTGYISFRIQKAIGNVIAGEHGNGACTETVRKRRRSGEEFLRQVPMPDALPEQSVDPTAMPELRDLLYASCETEIDRQIIDLRERGYRDSEIAGIIDTPLTTTYMLRRAIYARFLEKSGMGGEA